jgi:hypothetical protein
MPVDPNDKSIYGTYQMESGTTFSMADGTEYTLARSPWFATLANDKVEPPKKEFQIQGSLKYSKANDPIEYSVTLGYEITQDVATDNTVAAVFNFKSTDASKLDVEKQSVTQFLRYRKKGDFSKYRYVMCTTKGKTAHVDNVQPYLGDISALTSLDAKPSAGASTNDEKFWASKQTDAVTAHGHFFEASTDKDANYARISGTNAEAQCIAKLVMPKFNDGSANFVGDDILGEYDIELGVRIQEAGQSATTNLKYDNKKTLNFKKPSYDDSISEEVKKHSEIYFDRFMDTGFVDFDAYEAFTAGSGSGKPKGKLELIGENIINSDATAAPVMRLTIKSRIPSDSLPSQNNYVYRHTLKLKN